MTDCSTDGTDKEWVMLDHISLPIRAISAIRGSLWLSSDPLDPPLGSGRPSGSEDGSRGRPLGLRQVFRGRLLLQNLFRGLASHRHKQPVLDQHLDRENVERVARPV